MSLIARVRNIRMQSTKITYTIQDITGRMRAVLWLDQEAMDEDVRFLLNYILLNMTLHILVQISLLLFLNTVSALFMIWPRKIVKFHIKLINHLSLLIKINTSVVCIFSNIAITSNI